jgi:mono/diheme cytochrome c family protein
MRAGWTIATLACILAMRAVEGVAQTGGGPGAATRSTMTGVYTADQAARGQDIYAGMCQSCHTGGSHTSPAFRGAWAGRRLSELFGYVQERMPKNDPGSLSLTEYADVVAYLLKMNRMPPGPAELPSDSVALKAIRIDTAAAPAGMQHR